MADEDSSLVFEGKPIGDLRVTDLKKELEERGLSKTGNKKELVQRLSESLLEERGGEEGGGDKVQERGRKQKPGRGHSSSRSKSGSSSSGSESRSRSRSVDDKSTSSSGSDSRSRSRSASSRSSSASGSPSQKKPRSSTKMKKRGQGVDNGTSRVVEMKEASAQRSPLKLKITMDMASPERSHVETVLSPEAKDKKKPVPEPSEPKPDTSKEKKQAKEEGMDVGRPKKDNEVELESPNRRISVEESKGDKRITVDSSKEDQRIAVTSPKDDRRVIQEKEADGARDDSQPNSTTTDVLDVKETGEIEKKEDDVKQEPRPPRKRRWGGRKVSPKRQISISSESLKGLIPDVTPILAGEPPAEMEVVKEEAASDHEKEDGEADDDDDEDDDERKNMKIRRTVTQVVSNEDRREVLAEEDHVKVQEDMDILVEPKVKSPPQIIRKLSRSKPLVVADEPQKARRSPSPAKHPTSRVIHIRNLVRPFTLRQLKELLERTGKLTEGGFWIDKIKSHCLVLYETDLDASKTRQALHNTKWPLSNPKNLSVDFSTEAELENFQDADKPIKREVPNEAVIRDRERERREREREKARDIDLRNRREPPIERRLSGREWDRAKVVQRSPSPRLKSRDRSRSREQKKPPKENRGKERRERKEKKAQDEEPPAKLLDDLFRKTKATPSVYWLPLTEQQALEGERRRIKEVLDRDKRRQELEEKMHAERKKREMERLDRRRKEQMAEREREKERVRRRSRSRSRDRRRR